MIKNSIKAIIVLVTFAFSLDSRITQALPEVCSPENAIKTPSLVQFSYGSKPGSWLKNIFTKSPWLSKLAGWYTRRSISRIHIPSFIKNNTINMDEALYSHAKDYCSFNDFFTRKLKKSARPIDQDDQHIISPCDGFLYAVKDLDEETSLFIKEKNFNLAIFLHDKELAQEFYGGTAIIIYLAPHNYHRFHFPFSAHVSLSQSIHGHYESVHPFVYSAGLQPLQENERRLIVLSLPTSAQRVALVPVGALCVGQITETYNPKNMKHQKGDEMGYFSFGGSTIVMIFPKDTIRLAQEIGRWRPIKMGQHIATFS